MDLQHIKIYAEYGSLGLYALGLVGFWLFALALLKTSFKHFAACMLAGIVWPLFIFVALFKQKKVNKQAPQFIQIGRK